MEHRGQHILAHADVVLEHVADRAAGRHRREIDRIQARGR
jgi:hypothetical protein